VASHPTRKIVVGENKKRTPSPLSYSGSRKGEGTQRIDDCLSWYARGGNHHFSNGAPLSLSLSLSLTLSNLLTTNIPKISLEKGHRVFDNHADIHGLDVVLDGIRFPEVEPTHRVELLVGRGGADGDGMLDDALFVGAWEGAGALHVNDGVAFDVLAGEALFGDALAAVRVYGAVGKRGELERLAELVGRGALQASVAGVKGGGGNTCTKSSHETFSRRPSAVFW
jgi:hypothetical protein